MSSLYLTLNLQPAPTDTGRIVHLTDPHTARLSRIPVLICVIWDVLLSDSPLGAQLRRPFWIPYNGDQDSFLEGANGDGILKAYLSRLRSKFRLYLQTTALAVAGSPSERKIVFIPLRPDRHYADAPSICFAPEHEDAVERIRARVANSSSPSPDDVAELRQMDIATIAAFLHEMLRLVWLARYPHSAELTPEKFKAPNQGSGNRDDTEWSLWGGLVELDLMDLSSHSEADGLFYDSWCPAADTTSGRYICTMRKGVVYQYLTRDGAVALCSTVLRDPQSAGEVVLGPDLFKTLSIPIHPILHTSSHSLAPRPLFPVKRDELPFIFMDLAKHRVRPPIRPCAGVLSVAVDYDLADRLIREDEERQAREAAEAELNPDSERWMKSML
ncbi:hypothetical protein B0H11DRAFT_2123956 [Mycena galericulata]|nr:hypothetical protein B0H11DRAFT_2123956 [Mycena galericulata]